MIMYCLPHFDQLMHRDLKVSSRGDDSSLPVCSVSCTVQLQLFTNIDILWLGQNQLIRNKYAARSWYSLWPIQLGKDRRTS